jgi:hypothetical protein
MMSPAARQLRKSGLTVMAGYFLIFTATFYANVRLHPTGAVLWILASLPVIPILIVIVLMGRYLRDERDEYKRDLAIRCLLWGTAGCIAVNFFSGFLAIYGWKGELPPFSAFWVFFIFMMAAKLSYRAQNRPAED